MSGSDRRPLVVGTNLKMHQTPGETGAFMSGLLPAIERAVAGRPETVVFVCPPFTSLQTAVTAARHAASVPVWVGAQNVHEADAGPFTGEISVGMLAATGADMVIAGHAERRLLAGERDETIAKKVQAALDGGLRVLLCVGESRGEHDAGASSETVRRQVKIASQDVEPGQLGKLLVAYEPVWAIGRDRPAGEDEIAPVVQAIEDALADRFGDAARGVPILYGGSVTADLAGELLGALPRLDGLLLGRIGLTVDGFAAALAAAVAARSA